MQSQNSEPVRRQHPRGEFPGEDLIPENRLAAFAAGAAVGAVVTTLIK